jgi:hypothetical protein
MNEGMNGASLGGHTIHTAILIKIRGPAAEGVRLRPEKKEKEKRKKEKKKKSPTVHARSEWPRQRGPSGWRSCRGLIFVQKAWPAQPGYPGCLVQVTGYSTQLLYPGLQGSRLLWLKPDDRRVKLVSPDRHGDSLTVQLDSWNMVPIQNIRQANIIDK